MSQTDRIITGATRIVFMIGTPIAQARSPLLFNRYFQEKHMDRAMVPLDVSEAALPAFVAMVRDAANCDGFVATLPHKRALLQLVQEASPAASALESVNVVRRLPDGTLFGDMADGPGFWNGAARAGFDPAGTSVVLAGAGAAGTAIAYEFAKRGGRRIAVWSKTNEEAAALAAKLSATGLEVETAMPAALDTFDMAINATPLGMAHAPGSAFSSELLASLPREGFVADAVTEPEETDLLLDAKHHGLRVIHGHDMTLGQFEHLKTVLGL